MKKVNVFANSSKEDNKEVIPSTSSNQDNESYTRKVFKKIVKRRL